MVDWDDGIMNESGLADSHGFPCVSDDTVIYDPASFVEDRGQGASSFFQILRIIATKRTHSS